MPAVVLYAANSTQIKVIGELRFKLGSGPEQLFSLPFITADVTTPIIGSDFIKFYDLLLDLRRNLPINNITYHDSQLTSTSINKISAFKSFSHHSAIAEVISEFKDISKFKLFRADLQQNQQMYTGLGSQCFAVLDVLP